jgi:hypothetical protein
MTNGTSLFTGRSFGGNPEGNFGWPETGTGSGDGIDGSGPLNHQVQAFGGNFVSGHGWTRSTNPADLAAWLYVKRKHLSPPEGRNHHGKAAPFESKVRGFWPGGNSRLISGSRPSPRKNAPAIHLESAKLRHKGFLPESSSGRDNFLDPRL